MSNDEFRTVTVAGAASPRRSPFDISAFGGFDIRQLAASYQSAFNALK
jgi:hypothetical protein